MWVKYRAKHRVRKRVEEARIENNCFKLGNFFFFFYFSSNKKNKLPKMFIIKPFKTNNRVV